MPSAFHHVEGRAAEPREDAPRAFASSLSPIDDGVSHATSRVLQQDAPLLPEPPSTDWSYGPGHYMMPELPLESSGNADAPRSPAPTPPGAGGDDSADPPPGTGPGPAPAPQPPSPSPPEGDPDAGDDPEPAPASCEGLCFFVELGLL